MEQEGGMWARALPNPVTHEAKSASGFVTQLTGNAWAAEGHVGWALLRAVWNQGFVGGALLRAVWKQGRVSHEYWPRREAEHWLRGMHRREASASYPMWLFQLCTSLTAGRQ